MALSPDRALDDGGPQAPGSKASTPTIVLEEPPPWWMQQTGKAGNIFFNSAIVAMLRGWLNPPRIEAPEAGAPEWATAEWAAQYRNRLLARRVGRDTIVFAAGCYLMDGVEAAMDYVRGKHDHYSKIMGGVAAGGLIGLSWYPSDPRGRALVTVAGAMIGLVSYNLEERGNAYLLEKQRRLERELLHKPEDQLRTELQPYYLRALLRAKQQQLMSSRRTAAEAAAAAGDAGGGGGFAADGSSAASGGGRLFGDDGGAAGGAASGPGATPSSSFGSAYPSSRGGSAVRGSGGFGGDGDSTGPGAGDEAGYRDPYAASVRRTDSRGAYGGSGGRGTGGLPHDRGVLVITEEGEDGGDSAGGE